jgi:predicted enzyme related to lactoylglutathione lyase
MDRIVRFEIHAEDPARAARFYHELFGWQFTRMGGPADYWAIVAAPEGSAGINGGLMRRPVPVEGKGVNAFICTIQVGDLDASFARALALGGSEALPKMAVPGQGWFAYVQDPEGNVLGMMQPDAGAA